MTPAVFTVRELCTRWKVGRPSILKAIADGRLPAFRVTSKAWRIRAEDVGGVREEEGGVKFDYDSVRFPRTWYNVTTQADHEWETAKRNFIGDAFDPRLSDEKRKADLSSLTNARTHYREWVLGWFWKLAAPIGINECVPSEVALLLAEDWDIRTA